MSIILSQDAYWDLFEQTPTTSFDITQEYPQQLGLGFWRTINLREGVELAIAHYQLHDDIIFQAPEREHPLEYSFNGGEYELYGSGIAPQEVCLWSAKQSYQVINVHIRPELFVQVWGEEVMQRDSSLRELLQKYQCYSGKITTAMQMILQQIWQCPYQGLVQQMYLESKVWELIALLIATISPAPSQTSMTSLKPDDIDRIHHAQEILLCHVNNPPTLLELARKVGLNDCTLKRGFRQVFGTTVFGYLYNYRMEQAQQLLQEGRFNVSEVAQKVGYANRRSFAVAFRKKFGVSPKQYAQ